MQPGFFFNKNRQTKLTVNFGTNDICGDDHHEKEKTKNETTDILEDGQTDRQDDIHIGSGYSSG